MDLNYYSGELDPKGFSDNMASNCNGNDNQHSSRLPVGEEEAAPSYADAFPPLPTTPNDASTKAAASVKWGKRESKNAPNPTPRAVLTTVTQVFSVPYEEKRYKNFSSFGNGELDKQNAAIRDVMSKTGATIEVSTAKDQSLTILVTGKRENVAQAKRLVLNALQTQAEIKLHIPREHHKFILGKGGQKLRNLELQTTAKINISKDSDVITIAGTKEGIASARHEIQVISDEQAKLAFERLPVPKIYHPFIIGPSNATLDHIKAVTGARINIPPPSVYTDELTVAGDKDGVKRAVKMIMDIYHEKERKCTTVSVEVPKQQHKYIIRPKGQGIQEIFAATGVSVEVPPDKSDQSTITLRGEPDKLGLALTQVYEKASSVVTVEVEAPKWLHRFIIGRGGQNIKKITEGSSKLYVEFSKEENLIKLEGPPNEVEACRNAFQASIDELKNTMDFAEFEVPQKWHRHIIGKNGANVIRIKSDTGTAINFPADDIVSDTIRIEGSPSGVAAAKAEIVQMVAKMENEKTRDIMIDHKFHRNIIGAGGENISEIRELFSDVQILFPDSNKKSNIVTIRGPKEEVDKCFAHLKKYAAELAAANYQVELPVIKKFHRNIIGKGGQTVKKIKDETNTTIKIPTESSPSDVITITGYKAQVEKAKKMILALQSELASIVTVELKIPQKIHTSLIGSKGRLIKSVMDECGDVHIHFPAEGTNSDVVVIRGVKEDVEKAKKQLLEMASDSEKQLAEKQLSSFTAEVHAKPEYHRYLIGRGGANISKLRQDTGARILFPTTKDTEKDLITIIGKQEAVEAAKEELLKKIKDLDNIIEGTVNVDPKHHGYFTSKRASVLRDIAEEFGGVSISMPREPNSPVVTLKGAADCVEGAKKRIKEIADDLESMVTIECEIAQKHHRSVMGPRGRNVQEVTSRNNVQIKFPDRAVPNGNVEEPAENGDVSPRPSSDIILIKGKQEDAEQAKRELLEFVPVSETIQIPFEYHRYIIGKNGGEVRALMNEFAVNIAIPPSKDESEDVVVTGPQQRVTEALQGLRRKVEDIEADIEDKKLRSFQLTIEVPVKYHSKIIGRKGLVVRKLRTDYDVQIQVPSQDSEGKSENPVVILTGYEENCLNAKAAILDMVTQLDQLVSIEVPIDHRVHNRIIGQKGKSVRKIMDEFKVDIRFPRDPNDDIVTITGPEDAVEDCEEHLLMLEEEYLDDVRERYNDRNTISDYFAQKSNAKNEAGGQMNTKGFVVRGAPWEQQSGRNGPQQVPDSSDTHDFPSLGLGSDAKANGKQGSAAWGPWSRN